MSLDFHYPIKMFSKFTYFLSCPPPFSFCTLLLFFCNIVYLIEFIFYFGGFPISYLLFLHLHTVKFTPCGIYFCWLKEMYRTLYPLSLLWYRTAQSIQCMFLSCPFVVSCSPLQHLGTTEPAYCCSFHFFFLFKCHKVYRPLCLASFALEIYI